MPPPTTPQDVKINFNRVGYDHSLLSDGGGIDVMAPTPGGQILGNYIFHSPAYGSIMPDEGSALWAIKNNVIEKSSRWYFSWFQGNHDLVADNNSIDNATDNGRFNGKDCLITNTHIEPTAPPWSSAAQAIIDFAGIEPAYRDIMTDQYDTIPVLQAPANTAAAVQRSHWRNTTGIGLAQVLHCKPVSSHSGKSKTPHSAKWAGRQSPNTDRRSWGDDVHRSS